MKFTVINDESHEFELQLEFSDEEKENYSDCLYDIALGCSRIILEMVKDLSEKEKAKKLSNFIIEEIKSAVDTCIEDHYKEQESDILEHSLYDFMEKTFVEWIEGINESFEIYEETDFIKKYQNKKINIAHSLSKHGEVQVFFSLEDPRDNLDIMRFPASLLEEDEERFSVCCTYCEIIATVAFDKLYGEDNNPLRNDDCRKLEYEIRKTIKSSPNHTN